MDNRLLAATDVVLTVWPTGMHVVCETYQSILLRVTQVVLFDKCGE